MSKIDQVPTLRVYISSGWRRLAEVTLGLRMTKRSQPNEKLESVPG